MKKTVKSILMLMLVASLLCTTAFAVQARWQNVASITPRFYSGSDHYSSAIRGEPGTTKIECTLTFYEKTQYGTYKEVSHASETYYGQTHTFIGYYNIEAGKTYKLVTEATVTCNGVEEDVSYSYEK